VLRIDLKVDSIAVDIFGHIDVGKSENDDIYQVSRRQFGNEVRHS
jgi:hypothetical protein